MSNYSAIDMTTAAAQGFRDGVASVANSEIPNNQGASAAQSAPASHSELIANINKALDDFTHGRASMRVPPLPWDVDMVLSECLKVLDTQSAPAGEREAFEHAYAKSQGIAEKAYSLWFERHGDGYTSSSVNASWQGWQQRASWQRTQSAGVPGGESLAELLESVRLGDGEAKPHGSGATYWNNAVIACQCAIRDALAAAPAQPAAQGYALVPIDPTPKMLVAYMEADGAVKRWKAMIAAAPSQPAAQEPYPHDHPLHRAVFMARESYTGSETFEEGVLGLIAELQEARHDQGEVQRLREALEGVVKRCSKEHGGSGYVGQDGQYLKVIDAALAASTGQEV